MNKHLGSACALGALILGGGAIADHCYQLSASTGTACDIGGCNTSGACTGTIVTQTDELVTWASGGHESGRRNRVFIDFLCFKTFKIVDPETGYCTKNASCSTTSPGSVLSGLTCSHPSGPPA